MSPKKAKRNTKTEKAKTKYKKLFQLTLHILGAFH